MPKKDKKAILKVLKKQARKRKEVSNASNVVVNSNSNSSNNSSSSMNKDWENWVLLHGKKDVVVEDVWGTGKALGVKYKRDKMNRFNLLSRAGR